jgi:hypothetical protein
MIIPVHLEPRSSMYGVIPLLPVDAFMERLGTTSLLCYLCIFYLVEGGYGKYGEDVHTELRKENLEERDHIEETGIDVRIILIRGLNKVGKRSMY